MKKYWEGLRPFEKRVVVGVAAMVFIVVNLWFVVPRFSDWSRTKDRMAGARHTLTIFQAAIAEIPTYRARIKELEGEGMVVAREDQAAQFSRSIVNEAAKQGISANISRVTFNTNDQFFIEASAQVGLTSVKEQELVSFLYDLGASNSLISVRDLGLRPADQNRYTLGANMKLVASYQKNPAKPATNQPAAKQPAVPAVKQPTPTIRTSAPTNKAPTRTSLQTNKPAIPPPSKQTKPKS